MDLTIGKYYKKSDFGIRGFAQLRSEFTVEGELLTFFSMVSKYKNIIEEDGFVYEGRDASVLIPEGKKYDRHRHVFIRHTVGGPYKYHGKGLYEKSYDDKRNKIYFKEEK